MKIFIMSLVGMIFLIACPFWAYWTATGGFLMAGLGVTFLLIAQDIEHEEIQAETLQSLKRRQMRAQMRAEQNRPITEPITERPPEEAT